MKKFRESLDVFRARSSLYEAKADRKEYIKRWNEPSGSLPHGDDAIDAYNKAHPHDKIPTDIPVEPESKHVGPKYLGQGAYGQVYKGQPGRVVKFDRNPSEKTLFNLMPKRLSKHPVTPQNARASQVEVPFDEKHPYAASGTTNALSREDLHNLNLHDEHDKKAYERITHLFNKMGTGYNIKSSKEDPNKKPEPYEYAPVPHKASRLAMFKHLHDWHKENQSSKDIADHNKKRLKTFASGIARYIHHGIIPSDMHSANLGKRSDGTIAMRDLGLYSVLGDNSPKTVNRLKSRKPLVSTKKLSPSAIAKLKQMKSK